MEAKRPDEQDTNSALLGMNSSSTELKQRAIEAKLVFLTPDLGYSQAFLADRCLQEKIQSM